jgi:hypothetical protein
VNEERIDPPLLAAQHMYSNSTAHLTTLDDRAGQKRHPHTGGYASDDAVERSELEARRAWPTELAHELLESLSIRAASSKYEDGRARCRRSGSQGRKGLPPTRRQKHKLLLEDLRLMAAVAAAGLLKVRPDWLRLRQNPDVDFC